MNVMNVCGVTAVLCIAKREHIGAQIGEGYCPRLDDMNGLAVGCLFRGHAGNVINVNAFGCRDGKMLRVIRKVYVYELILQGRIS